MKQIELTKGYSARVDDADFDWLSEWKWSAKDRKTAGGYYVRAKRSANRTTLYMHRAIWERHNGPIPDGMTVDHIRHGEFGGLDNRLSNLRLATFQEQRFNARKQPGCHRKYRGVSYSIRDKQWRASLKTGDKRWQASFESEIEAAKAWDAKAIEVRGPTYTKLNFSS